MTKKVIKTTKKAKIKKTTKKPTKKPTNPKSKKSTNNLSSDSGIVIVDDDLTIDQEKVNEERQAYLEEARSQEVVD